MNTSRHDCLVKELLAKGTLDKAIRFLENKRFPLSMMDVVAQDEFSHDVIVPFIGLQEYLVLGVT